MIEQPSVYLVSGTLAWVDRLFTSMPIGGQNLLPYGHVHTTDLDEADAAFLWVDSPLPKHTVFELGRVASHGCALLVGSCTRALLGEVDEIIGAQGSVLSSDPLEAYRTMMADLDIRLPQVFRHRIASMDGRCRRCRGTYRAGEEIRYSPSAGGYHKDCYERHLNRNPTEAIFNAELVEALRRDNAALEEELRTVRGF